MTRAVADATVLIYLSKLGELSLLGQTFDEVVVPDGVYTEVVERGRDEGYRDALGVEGATGSTLTRVDLEDGTRRRAADLKEGAGLGRGESEAIALAERVDGRCLTDDHAARTTASSLGVAVGGTLYVLLSGLEQGTYSFPGYVSRLDALTEHGFRMDASLYRQAVAAGEAVAGELD